MAQKRPLNTVNSGAIPALRVEEADGHYDMMFTINRGDARDPFPGITGASEFSDATVPSTVTYAGRPLNTSLQAIREIGSDVRAYVQLLPTGWSAPLEVATLGAGGALSGNGATTMVGDPTGDLWLATVDDASGASEIVLRRKRFGIDWGAAIPLTNEPGVSNSPALAIDKSGRKAITWWDTRDGNSEIYYSWAPRAGVRPRAARDQQPRVLAAAGGHVDEGRAHRARVDGRARRRLDDLRARLPPRPGSSEERRARLFPRGLPGPDELGSAHDRERGQPPRHHVPGAAFGRRRDQGLRRQRGRVRRAAHVLPARRLHQQPADPVRRLRHVGVVLLA
jgi:hypothetical protein